MCPTGITDRIAASVSTTRIDSFVITGVTRKWRAKRRIDLSGKVYPKLRERQRKKGFEKRRHLGERSSASRKRVPRQREGEQVVAGLGYENSLAFAFSLGTAGGGYTGLGDSGGRDVHIWGRVSDL